MHSLGVELLVVYRLIRLYHVRDVGTKITAVARRVAQHLVRVRRTDERGVSPLRTNRLAVHATYVRHRLLEQMLHERKLLVRQLVELIYINNEETTERAFCLLVTAAVYAVRVERLQLRRQQLSAEC